MTRDIHSVLSAAQQQLTGLEDARLEVEIMLCHCLDKPRSYLHTWPEAELTEQQFDTFQQLLQRRIQGEPIAYITGTQGFWTLDLEVNPHVLIPRPETETLVEQALAHLPLERPSKLADLGTGSGAIALAIACERPLCDVLAVDLSADALRVAQQNANRLKLGNVNFLQSRWLEQINNGLFDMIVSNPPYVANNDPHLRQGDLRFEPVQALSSGDDGLDDIRVIIRSAVQHLKPGGWLLLEHGWDQAKAIRQLFHDNAYTNISSQQDLNNIERVTLARTQADS